MPDPLRTYAATAVIGDEHVTPPPGLLSDSLRTRLRRLRTDADLQEWTAAANEWAWYADARYRACVELRPATAPIRIGVKDTVAVAGFPTRLGLRRHRHYPHRTAAALDHLGDDPGLPAQVTAKVVTTEVNIGVGSGCGNPYFPHIDPAGSSTGSGVAVAAGICDLSLATDVLGSTRWPAGRCGVVGLRATHDPATLNGIFPLTSTMDAVGWMARTPDDLALLWPLLGLPPAPPRYRLRIGVVQEVLDDDVEPEILAALHRSADALAEAGHQVGPARIGPAWLYRAAAWEMCSREAWDGYQTWRTWIGDDLTDSTRLALESGRTVSDGRFAEIRAAQHRSRIEAAAQFADHQIDAWLLPLDPDLPRPADAPPPDKTIPTADQSSYDRDIGYTPIASFLGLPAITLPVARTTTDAPLAMQLVGPRHTEATLLRLAHDLAARTADLGLVPR
ncbi:amidase [Winogradskya consettensis]|uniref:Amidase n=1 Tax=Winogradskya consettensis TaxID=113560 RepID=A0A919T2D0_9ACTN|nr:amidase [Actinoplanes consettensis]GIM82300.1 amidase [Actinoplanes consettensis]